MKKLIFIVVLSSFYLCGMQEYEHISDKQKIGCAYVITHFLFNSCTNATSQELQMLPEKNPTEVVYYIFNKPEQAPLMQPEPEIVLWKKIIFVTGCGCALILTLSGIVIGVALA